MKKLTFILLLFFIPCSSQEKVTDKKYMDMENTFQKYRDIKARYDSLVEKNKQNLVYQNGAYFKKTLYNKEVRAIVAPVPPRCAKSPDFEQIFPPNIL